METARILTCLAFFALSGCATEKAATAEPKVFNVPLTKQTCAGAGANAAGAAVVTVAADGSTVMVTVTYSGLSGEPTAAHIHWGASGVNGPVLLPFSGPLASPFSRNFSAADYLAAAGAPADFAAFVVALKAGGVAYVNVHTAACKPGEIRGEIQ